ncbi:rRNA maturation RNase YbeY [Chamaesiphon sp. OTE_75_metabat_556]|jgi:probable rRNA maturation factor|uniref:rRNA maturation RNase YbeY n=1 Tax=Chamaesiphon sp. OTE_75_metabat_556 TaxID=2964692 RepID=UPI00286AFEB7|nr:rRNA maturation RNase YbeY [Chamaesiphon sp. OTE_75_metabat_556]
MHLELIVQDLYQPSVVDEHTWVNWFENWLQTPALGLPPGDAYELSLRLTSDGEIQALNAQFRQQDRPTDVLSFAALEVDFPQGADNSSDSAIYLGDIIISVDTAVRQAPEHGYSLRKELAWLASHGLLHLLGWDHPDEASLLLMLDRQSSLLRSSGFRDLVDA